MKVGAVVLACALLGAPVVGWYIGYVFLTRATNPQL